MGTARLFFGWSGKNQNRKNTAFQPEPHGKFPVEPGKTGTGKNELYDRKFWGWTGKNGKILIALPIISIIIPLCSLPLKNLWQIIYNLVVNSWKIWAGIENRSMVEHIRSNNWITIQNCGQISKKLNKYRNCDQTSRCQQKYHFEIDSRKKIIFYQKYRFAHESDNCPFLVILLF